VFREGKERNGGKRRKRTTSLNITEWDQWVKEEKTEAIISGWQGVAWGGGSFMAPARGRPCGATEGATGDCAGAKNVDSQQDHATSDTTRSEALQKS